MTAGTKTQNEVKKDSTLVAEHLSKRKVFAVFNTSKCLLFIFPSLWKFE